MSDIEDMLKWYSELLRDEAIAKGLPPDAYQGEITRALEKTKAILAETPDHPKPPSPERSAR